MSREKGFQVILKAVIKNDDGEYLLINMKDPEDSNDIWDIPGGHIRFGDNIYSSLWEKVRDSTGLEIDVIKPSNVWSHVTENRHLVGITFFCKTDSKKTKKNPGDKRLAWADSSKILDSKIPKWLKDEIRAVEKNRNALDEESPENDMSGELERLYEDFRS